MWSRSQAWRNGEGWRQKGHLAIKILAPIMKGFGSSQTDATAFSEDERTSGGGHQEQLEVNDCDLSSRAQYSLGLMMFKSRRRRRRRRRICSDKTNINMHNCIYLSENHSYKSEIARSVTFSLVESLVYIFYRNVFDQCHLTMCCSLNLTQQCTNCSHMTKLHFIMFEIVLVPAFF